MADPSHRIDRSYRGLLRVPSLGRILLGMGFARVAQAMVAIALVLFTLAEYRSPELAGFVTFASVFPGIAISPIAGVLLDRHGRIRLMILDYVVAAVALFLVAALASVHALPWWMLVLIAVVMSLTSIFSSVGLRTLFPLIVPRYLWERANALDSNGYVVATILGPPIAASLVAFGGGPVALFAIGLVYAVTALSMVGVDDPLTEVTATGTLLNDARAGLVYVWRNPTLRGLGVSVSVLNLTGGMTTIVIPLLVLRQLGANEALVGILFAISGVSGMVSALVFGRIDTRGRERAMLVVPPFGYAAAVALVLPVALAAPVGTPGALDTTLGIGLIAAAQLLVGLVNGPLDIALFTVRQRRTDPAWLGRAFAISMGFNFVGFPIGAAIFGVIAANSLGAAVVLGIGACIASGIIAAVLIPARDAATEPTA
ncbi:MAG TPA: MFS transporter [Candidatus Limnocylindrales bacterium]